MSNQIINIEITDTYAGESNYSWVKREKIESKKVLSDLAIVRRVKKMAGWTNIRCEVENYGDKLVIRPRGICQIAFVG